MGVTAETSPRPQRMGRITEQDWGAGWGSHPAMVESLRRNPRLWEARLIFKNEFPEGHGGGNSILPAGEDCTAP